MSRPNLSFQAQLLFSETATHMISTKQVFTNKYLSRSLILKKLQAFTLHFNWKRVSSTVFFLWVFRNLLEHHLYRATLDNWFFISMLYTISLTASLKRKEMSSNKTDTTNLNLFMVAKTNIIRSRHMFLSIKQFSVLIRCMFYVTWCWTRSSQKSITRKRKRNPGYVSFFINQMGCDEKLFFVWFFCDIYC